MSRLYFSGEEFRYRRNASISPANDVAVGRLAIRISVQRIGILESVCAKPG